MSRATDTAAAGTATDTATALRCENVSAGYGGQPVIRGIDLTLRPGEVAGLFGPNGAGKTTLLLAIAGLLPLLGGRVTLGSQDVSGMPTHLLVRRGLSFVPDDRELFTQLSCRDNLRLAQRRGKMTVDDALDLFPALRTRLKVRAGQLSGGEQQMLALGRGLMSRPSVLMVDEMSMGLAPLIVQSMLPVLRSAAAEVGTAVLLVEQHVRMALDAVDHAYALVHGEMRIDAPAARIRGDDALLQSLYLAEGISAELAENAEPAENRGATDD